LRASPVCVDTYATPVSQRVVKSYGVESPFTGSDQRLRAELRIVDTSDHTHTSDAQCLVARRVQIAVQRK
jgi:hypothetical protein